jgi:hypothetical protein
MWMNHCFVFANTGVLEQRPGVRAPTKLYDRTKGPLTQDEVETITL